jgi:hypothetical protein
MKALSSSHRFASHDCKGDVALARPERNLVAASVGAKRAPADFGAMPVRRALGARSPTGVPAPASSGRGD